MAIMDMCNEFPDKVQGGEGDVYFLFFLVILVPEGDDIIDEGGDSGMSDGWAFCVASDILDGLFGIAQFFTNMNIPLDGAGIGLI